MKKLLVAAAIGLTAVGALAQGQFNFANRVLGSGIDARVMNEAGGWASQGYFAQAYVGLTEESLAPVGEAVQFRFDVENRYGYINGVPVTVPAAPIGTEVYAQMRAWKGSVGGVVYASYDESVSKGGVYGKSNAVKLKLGGDTVIPPDMVGLQGFALVPEPSSMALGLLGAAVLLLRRRNQAD